MDFNDIKSRVDRVYSAIGEVQIVNWQKEIQADWGDGFTFIFQTGDESINSNKILSVISALANLKDNLKNKMSIIGLDSNLVEQEINSSLYLQLITDLDNQDKHGYPLRRSKRSNKDPQIKKIESYLRMKGDPNSSEDMELSFDLGSGQINTLGSISKVIIDAEIVDSSGDKICSLDELVSNSISLWEAFIKLHGIR